MLVPSAIRRRRPSAAMLVACAGLFVSLGGVGYAAGGLVHSRQIANGAVTYRKIARNSVGRVRLADNGVINVKIGSGAVSSRNLQPGSVGAAQANIAELQARVSGTCPSGQGLGSIATTGAVTCNPVAPAAYYEGADPMGIEISLTGAQTTVASLPTVPMPGSYVVSADVHVRAVSGSTPQSVMVRCELNFREVAFVTLQTDGVPGDDVDDELPIQGIPDVYPQVSCNASTRGTLPPVYANIDSLTAIVVTPSS